MGLVNIFDKMGLLLSRMARLFEDWGNTPARILMLGLDAAGTSIYFV